MKSERKTNPVKPDAIIVRVERLEVGMNIVDEGLVERIDPEHGGAYRNVYTSQGRCFARPGWALVMIINPDADKIAHRARFEGRAHSRGEDQRWLTT